jgi:hypothetical protein
MRTVVEGYTKTTCVMVGVGQITNMIHAHVDAEQTSKRANDRHRYVFQNDGQGHRTQRSSNSDRNI